MFQCKITPRVVPIPTPTAPYKLDVVDMVSTALLKTKSLMDEIYIRAKRDPFYGSHWGLFQYYVDSYKHLNNILPSQYNAHPVTTAWTKFYELATFIDLGHDKPARVFFNAELPGAGIGAFNHYCVAHNRPFEWVASSLNPNVDRDAFEDVYGVWRHNPTHWLITDGFDGDMMNPDNFDKAAEMAKKKLGDINVYIHDAGVDIKGMFDKQESMTTLLHLGCAIVGLKSLSPGGTFVAKQFTAEQTLTWNLIVIYASMFEQFNIVKPITSRAFNSEIYLVGRGYKGPNDQVITALTDIARDIVRGITPHAVLPAEYVRSHPMLISELRDFMQVFSRQIRAINEMMEDWQQLSKYVKRDKAVKVNIITEKYGNYDAHNDAHNDGGVTFDVDKVGGVTFDVDKVGGDEFINSIRAVNPEFRKQLEAKYKPINESATAEWIKTYNLVKIDKSKVIPSDAYPKLEQ